MAPILDRQHGFALIVHGMWMRVLRGLRRKSVLSDFSSYPYPR